MRVFQELGEELAFVIGDCGARVVVCDILFVGMPCQAFSVAGQHAGLDDEKRGPVYRALMAMFRKADAKVIVIEPSYDVAKLDAQIMTLADAFGTKDVAEERARELEDGLTAVSKKLKADLGDRKPVIVAHLFAAEWAGFAGLQPAGTYGPEPITASKTAELAALKPAFVFENRHMAGSGAAVAGASGAKVVELINFPGDDLDLIKVAEQNADAIRTALTG